MRVRWTAPAKSRLRDIEWFIGYENPAAARRTRRTIRERTSLLAQFPNMGRASIAGGFRELVVGGTPWIVTYRVSEREVLVVDVRHASEEWFENL